MKHGLNLTTPTDYVKVQSALTEYRKDYRK